MTEDMPMVALRDAIAFPYATFSFDVGRDRSIRAIRHASQGGKVFLAMQKDESAGDYAPDTVNLIGTACKIKDIKQTTSTSVRVTVTGLYRARMRDAYEINGNFIAAVEEMPIKSTDPDMEEAYFRVAKANIANATFFSDKLPRDALGELDSIKQHDRLLYAVAARLDLSGQKAFALYSSDNLCGAYELLNEYIRTEISVSQLQRKINTAVKEDMDKNQKEFYLREQLKVIHNELGDDEDEKYELETKIKERGLPGEVEEKALKELSHMGRIPVTSPEYNVIRVYLDWILDLPWGVYTEDTPALSDAVAVLENDHYGLEKVKERITEYLAVLKLTDGLNAPILCLVGPPGVGKTSIASSVARALGRKFVRMSLGGVRDEAEIRGHRKTYIGAMPGRIINAMKSAGSMNPVFLMDEIDKMSSDYNGDPASALLEVLDPAQNSTFRDRYMEVPFDLSRVLFITTANSLDTIPAPLRDRMEIINLSGYTHEEKREIAKRFLVDKRRKANGLADRDVTIRDDALDEIISGYTMEAGVRELERQIDSVCRKAAVKKAGGGFRKVTVTQKNVPDYLGIRKYGPEKVSDTDEVGSATGLAWTTVGGVTMTIEVSAMQGKGDILLTGQLGDVMKESARAAISYIRSRSDEYGIDGSAFETTDIHVHVPEGATPKDGPSAGITMATAILSAFTNKPVRHDVAMTGEITLRGKVLPIGGLKEKALAAYRVGIRDVIIPEDNRKDLEEIPSDIKDKINFITVSSADTVFKNAIIGL